METIIKHQIFPINEKLGVYFLFVAEKFNDENKKKYLFNLGVDILLNQNKVSEYITKEIIIKLMSNEDYSHAFFLLSEFFSDNSKLLLNK